MDQDGSTNPVSSPMAQDARTMTANSSDPFLNRSVFIQGPGAPSAEHMFPLYHETGADRRRAVRPPALVQFLVTLESRLICSLNKTSGLNRRTVSGL